VLPTVVLPTVVLPTVMLPTSALQIVMQPKVVLQNVIVLPTELFRTYFCRP
jgi:hypothetical protein